MAEVDMFSHLVAQLGEPKHAWRMSKKEASQYSGRVPDALITFWIEHGRGSYQDGSFFFCEPSNYNSIVEDIFEGDREFDPKDMVVFGCTAMGDLYIWSKSHKEIIAFPKTHQINCPNKDKDKFSPDFRISTFATAFMDFDLRDEHGQAFIPQAIRAMGELQPDEIYGYVPALSLGGAPIFENLRRFKAREHLALLCSLGPFTLMELGLSSAQKPFGSLLPVRQIGN